MSGRLIGINGFKGSGKDEVRKRLAALGYDPVRLAFADKLKVSAMASLGFRHDGLGNRRTDEELIALADLLKEQGSVEVRIGHIHHVISGRRHLQYKGTEGGRDVFGDSFWVDLVMDQACLDVGSLVAITDVRFPNEAKAVLDFGGEVWEVIGPPPEAEDGHPSEKPLPPHLVSRTIDNTVRDDSFASLDRQILTLMGVG